MKKLGKEVLFLPTSERNPRNGEGGMIRLLDGRILYAYTQYNGDDWNDNATAQIAAYYSDDEGETWYDGGVLIEKDAQALNIMSVSLIRMANGDLGVLYLRKSMKGNDIICIPYLARSADEGKTFSAPIRCIADDGLFVVNNDRIIRLSSGRLLIAVAYHGLPGEQLYPGRLLSAYSDDDGRTWQCSDMVKSPYDDELQFQEPGVFELPDGRVMMWCRTAYGHQYHCISHDGGKTWGATAPLLRFTSPDSPMQIRTVGRYTLSIFNPMPYHCLHEHREFWGSPKRSPLICAVSRDGGLSFIESFRTFTAGGFDPFVRDCYFLEDDLKESYCYPSILEVNDGFLVSYYHSNGTGICLNSAKVIKVYFTELEN